MLPDAVADVHDQVYISDRIKSLAPVYPESYLVLDILGEIWRHSQS